jgi:hypothetical protein
MWTESRLRNDAVSCIQVYLASGIRIIVLRELERLTKKQS